ADAHGLAAVRILAEIEYGIVGVLRALLDRAEQAAVLLFLVAVIELAQELDRLALAARDLVEVFFHLGGEVGFDEVAEVIAQQLGHREGGEAGDERLALSEHVAAAGDGRDRRCESGRPADAEPLELLDER